MVAALVLTLAMIPLFLRQIVAVRERPSLPQKAIAVVPLLVVSLGASVFLLGLLP
jgi:uncharacterized lipoprotein YbaY